MIRDPFTDDMRDEMVVISNNKTISAQRNMK